MKFLFLDVDGVLNDHRHWESKYTPILYDRVSILNTIFDSVPDLHIVFSSAWRYAFNNVNSVQALLMCHGFNHYGHVHGVTCSDEEIHGGKMPLRDNIEAWETSGLRWRVLQIYKYLEENPCEQYVVLDDLPLSIRNLVQTDPTKGLTESDAQKAIEILQSSNKEENKLRPRFECDINDPDSVDKMFKDRIEYYSKLMVKKPKLGY